MDAETKAAYFGAHWGQPLIYKNEFGTYAAEWNNPNVIMHLYKKKSWLSLTPLSSITHAQVVQMCCAADRMPFSGRNNESKWIVDIKERGFAKVTCSKNIYSFMVDLVDGEVDVYMEGELITSANNRAVADYLRKEGFAIGFRQWSVDQLVELGVLKLREVENG